MSPLEKRRGKMGRVRDRSITGASRKMVSSLRAVD